MPSVTFTYPDELQELVHNATCSQYGYLEEIDNPEFNPQEIISELIQINNNDFYKSSFWKLYKY